MIKIIEMSKIVDKSLKRDHGDIPSLAQSIKENGLLQPLVMDENENLICGGRRFEAAKLLKWKKVSCHIISVQGENDMLRKQFAENVQHKNFNPVEMVEIAKRLRPEIAKEMKVGRPKNSEKFSEFKGQQTREIVAKQLNTSFKTLEKAEEIVDSKEKELIDEMRKTEAVDPVYKKLKKKQKAKETTESESEGKEAQLERFLVQIKKKIEKLNKSLAPLLEFKDIFHSARCQKSKEGQDFVYGMAELFGTVHVLMSKKRKEVNLIESFKRLVKARENGRNK